jgi:hypothetical protein
VPAPSPPPRTSWRQGADLLAEPASAAALEQPHPRWEVAGSRGAPRFAGRPPDDDPRRQVGSDRQHYRAEAAGHRCLADIGLVCRVRDGQQWAGGHLRQETVGRRRPAVKIWPSGPTGGRRRPDEICKHFRTNY